MAQKIRPDLLRLGIVRDWQTRWFFRGSYRQKLEEDLLIRKVIFKKIALAGLISIVIERNASDVKIIIKAARPGLIIGRGGKGIEDLTKLVEAKLVELHRKRGTSRPSIKLVVDELRRNEISAANLAQNIAWDIEKRMPFRRLLKKSIETTMQNREVQGVKIKISGRLNGAEIARSEWLAKGKLPLQTLRANIDYGERTAYTTYGTIGVKVWIYKGDIFDDK